MSAYPLGLLTLLSLNLGGATCATQPAGAPVPRTPWPRHIIDDASRGADGVRLADADGDGRADIVTGWEEGGVIRLCLNPGAAAADRRWPAVTVGKVASPEDAVLVDLDADGNPDAVSACEGSTRTIFVHWAPPKASILNADAWRTETLEPSSKKRQWMFVAPVDVDGDQRVDLVAGAKGDNAQIGWFRAPPAPRDLAAWTYTTIADAGWIMSLIPEDFDGDGDPDLLVSDRKGRQRGVFWLENPGAGAAQSRAWPRHPIGGGDHEVMFLTQVDIDGDRREDVVAATAARRLLIFLRPEQPQLPWREIVIDFPDGTGTGKAVAAGDFDGDDGIDLAVSCENAAGRSGVFILTAPVLRRAALLPLKPRLGVDAIDVSGNEGAKYDLLVPHDLDGDGDLDLITCEERENLGVVWYENPR